jgi:hypothetical protein
MDDVLVRGRVRLEIELGEWLRLRSHECAEECATSEGWGTAGCVRGLRKPRWDLRFIFLFR